MIKVSLNLEISLSQIFIGFAGLSVAVGALHSFASKKNKQICLESGNNVPSDTKDKQAIYLKLVKHVQNAKNDTIRSLYKSPSKQKCEQSLIEMSTNKGNITNDTCENQDDALKTATSTTEELLASKVQHVEVKNLDKSEQVQVVKPILSDKNNIVIKTLQIIMLIKI